MKIKVKFSNRELKNNWQSKLRCVGSPDVLHNIVLQVHKGNMPKKFKISNLLSRGQSHFDVAPESVTQVMYSVLLNIVFVFFKMLRFF